MHTYVKFCRQALVDPKGCSCGGYRHKNLYGDAVWEGYKERLSASNNIVLETTILTKISRELLTDW